MTPASVPATPAAQPYGYVPCYREQKIAEMTDCYDRPIYVVSPRTVFLLPITDRNVKH